MLAVVIFLSFWLQDQECSMPGLYLSLRGPLTGKDPGGSAPLLSICQTLLGQMVTAQDHRQREAAARGSILGWLKAEHHGLGRSWRGLI